MSSSFYNKKKKDKARDINPGNPRSDTVPIEK